MRVRFLTASLTLLLGCSDFECPDGQFRVDGMCPPPDAGLVDPDPKTKMIELGCSNNVDDDIPSLLSWELTVNPTAIVGGEPFHASVEAVARFSEYFLNVAQQSVPVNRVQIVELHATVHVRRGVTDSAEESDVTLTFADARTPIPWTCRYDGDGNTVFLGDEFPTCTEDNNNPDDSNEDCTGLSGAPHPDNPCGQFINIPTSTDCDVCESLGDPFPGLDLSPLELCEKNEFCVAGPQDVALQRDQQEFAAADSGYVLFGWDDASTGAEIDQTSGPNDGAWDLPPAIFDETAGPNAMRFAAGEKQIALECTMATSSFAWFGVESRDDLASPAPDHLLISFPIQEP
jgi:hypothetical protein